MTSFRIDRQTMLLMILGVVFLTLLSGCTAPISSETSASDVDLEALQELMDEQLSTPIEPTALALINRDYALLQEIMSDPFTISYWDQMGQLTPPEDAMAFLRSEYFDQADSIVIGTATDFTALLGFDILAEVEDGEAFYLQWSGDDLRSEGVALLERLPDGTIQWPYILIAEKGFTSVAPPLPANPVPEVEQSGPYWETIQIEIDPGRADRIAELRYGLGVQQYVVYGQAGQVLVVTASSQSTTPIDLSVMDPSGVTTFAEDRSPDVDDESILDRSRYVSSSTLTQSGGYVIGLATLDGYSDVDYKVIIELYTPPDEEIPPAREPSEEASEESDIGETDEVGTNETLTEEAETEEIESEEVPDAEEASSPEADDAGTESESGTRIEFAPDEAKAYVTGIVASPERASHLITLEKDQTISIEVTASDKLINFSVVGLTDGQIYKRLVNEDRKFEFTSSIAQDYEVTVARTEGESTYAVYVNLLN